MTLIATSDGFDIRSAAPALGLARAAQAAVAALVGEAAPGAATGPDP